MTYLQAIFLGIIQGLTEFFPVSSSAHLKMVKLFLGIDKSEFLFFDLICHMGTLLALIGFFRKELFKLILTPRHWGYYFLALIPLIPTYFLLKTYVLSLAPLFGGFLFITGIFLYLASKSQSAPLPYKKKRHVLCIGIMQSMALIPGISRSGTTIATACMQGWEMKKAVEFSFFLAIPTIIGGTLLEGVKAYKDTSFVYLPFTTYFLGFLFSFIFGLLAVSLIARISRKMLKVFAWYCMGMGILSLFYF